jgi:hypothetical protein
VRQPEPAPDQAGTREYRFDFLGYRIGRYIVVFGYFAHQKITHTPAHDIGLITLFLQTADDFGGVRTKLLNRDSMFSGWNDNVFSNNKFPKL